MAQPIILHASTLKRKKTVRYVTAYKRKEKPIKRKGILYVVYIGPFVYNAGGPFLESGLLFSL